MFHLRTYIVCFLIGCFVAWALTPWVIRLAVRLRALDRPANRKIHLRVVPRLGGIALFVGMWVPLVLLLLYDNEVARNVMANGEKLLLIFLGGLAMLAVGILDDIRGVGARWKFAVQFPVAIGLVAAGIRFDTLSVPFLGVVHLEMAGYVVSVLWLVGVTNALNLIDGIDGLASGVAYLIAVSLAILSIYHKHPLLAVVLCSMAGACFGFLRFNFSPAKIFLGDSGSLFLGMTLAVSATLGSVKEQLGASLILPMVLLAYPIADTLLSMARRFIRGKPIFTGDASHIHHRLLHHGLDHPRVCLTLYGVCITFCLWSFAIAQRDVPFILLGTVVVCALTAAGMYYLGYLSFLQSPRVANERNRYKAVFHFSEMLKAKLSNAETREGLLELLEVAAAEFQKPELEVCLPESALGAPILFHRTWTTGQEPILRETGLCQDRYQFDNTGLVVKTSIRVDPIQEELITEKRRVFGEICEEANHRLLGMLRAAEREGPPPPGLKSVDASIEKLPSQKSETLNG